jgi:excisionase family DNA binding protein
MRSKSRVAEAVSGAPSDVLNAEAVAKLLGCRVDAVSKLCASGDLRGKKIGHGGWRVTRQAVLDFLEGGKK